MEEEFRNLVSTNPNFDFLSLEAFSALSDDDNGIFFDTTTIAGTTCKANVLALRSRYLRNASQGKSNLLYLLYIVS